MLILQQASSDDVTLFGHRLLNQYRDVASSFEQAAQVIVREIHQEFQTAQGQPLFALLRIFRFGPKSDLSVALLERAIGDDQYWLTLMATQGDEPAWCERQHSHGHQVIPADAPVTPMLKAAFADIGLDFGGKAKSGLHMNQDASYTRYFLVNPALGSPFIPAQDEFVKPYQIASVVGIGAAFEGHSSHMMLGFSRVPITNEEAARFNALNPHISTLLAIANLHQVWS